MGDEITDIPHASDGADPNVDDWPEEAIDRFTAPDDPADDPALESAAWPGLPASVSGPAEVAGGAVGAVGGVLVGAMIGGPPLALIGGLLGAAGGAVVGQMADAGPREYDADVEEQAPGSRIVDGDTRPARVEPVDGEGDARAESTQSDPFLYR